MRVLSSLMIKFEASLICQMPLLKPCYVYLARTRNEMSKRTSLMVGRESQAGQRRRDQGGD